jgi:NADPH-dependent glutamate synthase beta subunit-like oxidoreductase/NAD(P)H-flavin reductase
MFGFGIQFQDLYAREGLSKVDAAFVADLAAANVDVHNRFVAARNNPDVLADKEHSNLLIEVAPYLEDYLGKLFGISGEVAAMQETHHELGSIYTVKRLFVQRQAAKKIKPEEAATLDGEALAKELEKEFNVHPKTLPAWATYGGAAAPLFEHTYAANVAMWLEHTETYAPLLDLATKYGAWALYSEAGKHKHRLGVLFKLPKKLDFHNLVPVETIQLNGVTVKKLPEHDYRERDGFKLTDDGGTLIKALDEVNYCIWCHNQGKDSCSKGFKDKENNYKVNELGITQAGCPLEEKISEMHTLKAQGYTIGGLAMITVDNPMCAGTGHRICNDCMKGCIYQKQEPVNIPQAETRTLNDVLRLPYGFEIYSLLTRWNPLNLHRPLPKADTNYKVLVVGLGPAGYTLAHHLMNDGHIVVGVDGLKIEPVDPKISGVDGLGNRHAFEPIKDINTIYESLDERTLAGFGGVAEYGITVRWNKNYLKVLRLLLERRAQFNMIGGIRFGSNITEAQAWEMGFDHIALCMGAGKPTVIDMPNAMARGVRTASDFLMALQLTGAAKKDSIANLTVRLPVAVIGGGLTGIDTTTESLAYYPIQVEKFLQRYETLVKERGEAALRGSWSEEEKELAEEFITHAKALRQTDDKIALLQSWGGATLVYRKTLADAPAYRLNHEEVELAMQEGIYFIENGNPIGIEVDKTGAANGLKVKIGEEEKIIPARTIFMAAGTSPNTILAREEPNLFKLDGKYFQAVDLDGNLVKPELVSKPEVPQVLMSGNISFFGDLHPSFAGNVVKAMGSAKQGYPIVTKALQKKPAQPTADFFEKVNNLLRARVHEVIRLTPNIIEVVVKAPLAARNFLPGQFYRLQNYEANAIKVDHTTLAMEGLALTGASVDKAKGLMSTIVLEMGGSSDLCAYLKKDEPVVLMGPTGEPTHTPACETVMLVGGGLGNAVLFSIGKALRDAGSKVLYFAGYKKVQDRYKVKEIEEAADNIIWCCDEATFTPERPQDQTFQGNIVQAMVAYGEGKLKQPIAMPEVDRIIVIGSDRMMAAVTFARHNQLKPFLKPKHEALGSINSPMQCMMKEICAQCLQKHVDPVTGKESYVYSCFNQDQKLDHVSWPHLNERLKQNTLQEKLTKQWIDRSLKLLNLRDKVA